MLYLVCAWSPLVLSVKRLDTLSNDCKFVAELQPLNPTICMTTAFRRTSLFLAAGSLLACPLSALTVDIGMIDFGGSVHLDSTAGETDYLFLSAGAYQLIETTDPVIPVQPMSIFGPANAVPFGWEITQVDFSFTTDSFPDAGSNNSFEIYLSTGGNLLEVGGFSPAVNSSQNYGYSATGVSLVNANADEELYFAIKWTGTDGLRITDANLSLEINPVPEPAHVTVVFGLAAIGVVACRRRK